MKNSNGIFWTSTSFNTTQARFRELLHYTAQINHSAWNKDFGISVRCVKGYYTPNQPPEVPSNPNPPIGSVYANNYLHVAWSCSDPDGDPLTYDLYFGSESNPPLAIADIADTTYWSLYNLPYNNIYYWKVVARDIHGNTTEGPLWYFVTENFPWYCGDPLIDERDGKIYETVLIDWQCWMAENLNIGVMTDSTNDMTDNGIIEKYCIDNSYYKCWDYGGLYQWDEMMQYQITPGIQGICPPGWHIPTDEEWCVLEQYVDETVNCDTTGFRGTDGGGKLKEAGTDHWAPPNTGATDAFGFAALPGGYRNFADSTVHLFQTDAYFFTSNDYGLLNVPYRQFNYYSSKIYRNFAGKINGFSVRCIKY